MHLHPTLAPYKVAVLPLTNKLKDQAMKIHKDLQKEFHCFFDKSGSIGRRYARMDEVGTPYCITVDFETETDKSVTMRDRDSTKQVRVKLDKLQETIWKLLTGRMTFEEAGTPIVK